MNRTLGRRLRWILAAGGAVLFLSLLPAAPALALHDQGYICYTCHSLNPTEIRNGSNAARLDQPILATVRSGGSNVSRGLPSTGGYPLSCDFCHRAPTDVPTTKFADTYRHPVDTIAVGDCTANTREITCNDCHAGNDGGVADNDLTSASLLTRSATDGYPDHDNVTVGYAHNLTSNKPHLTKPYWGTTLPGANRTNDGHFWDNVRAGNQDIICWVCHETGRVNTPTSAPFTRVTSSKAGIKAEYVTNNPGNGHKIRTNIGGALRANAALPCYDCHDSHGSVSHGLVLDAASIEGTSVLAVTTFTGANDNVVCAGCHDTGLAATAAGTRVEGLNPVDPFNSTSSGALHAANGINTNMTASTKNCLNANGGCHLSPHNTLGTGNCRECHLGTGGSDTDSFSYNGTKSIVDNNQWATRGHGRTSAFPATASGNPAPNNGTRFGSAAAPNCVNFCHDANVRHAQDNTAPRNFFRLSLGQGGTRTNVTASTANNVCLQCHSTGGAFTAEATRDVDTAHWLGAHSATDNNGGFFCWDCHDPHGDNNDYMIGAQVASKTDNTGGTSLVGIPKTLRNAAFVKNTGDNVNGYDYMDYRNTAFTGVCQTCHGANTIHFSQTKDNTANHNKGATPEQRCTACHSHSADFVGAGSCDACHNATHTDIPSNPMTPFLTGSRKHVDNVQPEDCEVCHHSTQPMDGSGNNVLLLRDASTGAAISYAQDNSGAARLAINNFCLSCHDSNGANYTADGYVVTPLRPFSDCSLVVNMAQFWKYSATVTSHDNTPGASMNTVPIMAKVQSPHGYPDNNQLKQEAGWNAVNQTTYSAAAPVSCLQCHPAHGGSITSPTKRLNSVYAAGTDNAGLTGGIMLTATEPGLCWTCHTAAGVKDYWGDNTAGGHWAGTLNSKFAYKQRTMGSTHAVDNAGTGHVCSLCHNPHGAAAGPKYYTPMLRGTWLTSPYLEDRIGWLSTTTKTTLSGWSKLSQSQYGPRADSTTRYNRPSKFGGGYNDCTTAVGQDGYFIDENTFGVTGSMTTAWSTNQVYAKHFSTSLLDCNIGGLCATCHATAARAGGTIAAMKTFLTTSSFTTGWGTQIHNTVRGWAAAGTTGDRVNNTLNPKMHGYPLAGAESCFVYSTSCSSAWGPFRGYTWQAVPNTANQMTGTNAIHQFPCSKCHTPHASDLPRLMVTNCLDVGSATNQRKAHGTQAAWVYPPAPTQTQGPQRDGAAILCHGRRARNSSAAGDNGWNKVTGW